jgi:ornithine carbamoyltransferase
VSEASESEEKRWLPDQAENRLHAQKGLLVWLTEQE